MVACNASRLMAGCAFFGFSLEISSCFLAPPSTGDITEAGAPAYTGRRWALVAATAEQIHEPGTADAVPLGGVGQRGPNQAVQSTSTDFQDFQRRRKLGTGKVVLDLRSSEDFRRRHLVGSTSLPVDELEPRLLELPPPFGDPLTVVGAEEDMRLARRTLSRRGWEIDKEIMLDASEERLGAWPTETGSHSVQAWRANEFLEFCMERFLLPAAVELEGIGGAALDLGCGSGRDTVYMAQHLPPRMPVIGVDNHSHALERGARLASDWAMGTARSSFSSHSEAIIPGRDGRSDGTPRAPSKPGFGRRGCEWMHTDLRKDGSLLGVRASVIHGHRFKCEQLLPVLRDEVLVPGGFFVWSTFLDTGVNNAVPPWRPSRMLRPGELASIFSGANFDILADEAGVLPTRGSVVPASFFCCRKRSESIQIAR